MSFSLSHTHTDIPGETDACQSVFEVDDVLSIFLIDSSNADNRNPRGLVRQRQNEGSNMSEKKAKCENKMFANWRLVLYILNLLMMIITD